MAQLVEQSLPIPEIQSLAKIYIEHLTVNCIEKTKIKKKRPGKPHKKVCILYCLILLPQTPVQKPLSSEPLASEFKVLPLVMKYLNISTQKVSLVLITGWGKNACSTTVSNHIDIQSTLTKL